MDQQYSATVKYWTVSNVLMSTSGHNSYLQPKSPPINRLINDRLSVNRRLPQLINMSHMMLTDPLV